MQPVPHGLRLFTVEDEYLIADQVAKMFASRGAEVIGFAPTAQKAREIISRGASFDVAILDVGLRDGDVFTVADQIQESGATVVFYTGLDASRLPERFRTTTVVPKPADVDVLYASTLKACHVPLDQCSKSGVVAAAA